MPALACTLSELSPALQARTLYHHTVFGLARYLTSPRELPCERHPLDFCYLLGLSSKVEWHQYGVGGPIDPDACSLMFKLLAKHWKRDLDDFWTAVVAGRLRKFSPEIQYKLVREVATNLDMLYHISPLERFIAMKESDHTSIPQDVYNRLEASLAALEQSLLANDPLMPQHLRNSHAVLVSYPETVHLLQDHEVARLIDAAEMHTKTEIVKATVKGSGAGSGSKKKIAVSDL